MKGLGVDTLNQNEESVLGKLQKGLGNVISNENTDRSMQGPEFETFFS